MITLHTACEHYRDLFDQIDPDTGEMPDGFESARELVSSRALAVTAYIIEQDAQIEMARQYVKTLEAKVKAQERKNEWLKGYLKIHMQESGISEVKHESGLFRAKLERERDASLEVFDAETIPAEYLRTIPERTEPDKPAITKAIKSGAEVPGARIVKRDRLTIK